jgi:DNA-directed RNA polymerase specialized sigma24 family protein
MLLVREEGFKYRESVEAVGVKTSSVGTLLARALEKFAAELNKRDLREVDGHE